MRARDFAQFEIIKRTYKGEDEDTHLHCQGSDFLMSERLEWLRRKRRCTTEFWKENLREGRDPRRVLRFKGERLSFWRRSRL